MNLITPDGPMAVEAKGTVGETADATAASLGVPGAVFSFKADGIVLDRSGKAGELSKAGVLELIEVTDQESAGGNVVGQGSAEA